MAKGCLQAHLSKKQDDYQRPMTSDATRDRMRRIRSKGTGPEMRVRRLSHRLGFRHRLHVSTLPGKPDLVYPSLRKIIFVHGCFWHHHPGCRHARLPKTNIDYWLPKLNRNIERDKENIADLMEDGWMTMIIWECQTNREVELRLKLNDFLSR